MEIVSATIFVS